MEQIKSEIINKDTVTLEDLLENYKYKRKTVILHNGMITGYVEEEV